jgi:hypothetical protein
MKKTNLKILLTSLGFLALSTTFAQVDTSKSNMSSGDSLNRAMPQGSPVATDSTSVNSSSTQTWSSDSSSAGGYNKADKKRMKADKKEAKATKKESTQ